VLQLVDELVAGGHRIERPGPASPST
jgi:hypothetical protein